ncbi:hypothetical protein HMPREF0063_12279 [Aeromicrobium marinum DSM 15272]|uniref:PKD domain-containing protein n=1 Tax=Aeromicrobium marinum DSM 15272 TaxID=585531 RepID=E2SCW7_9ACTN|nr:hypothetical protein [Aeromicrobium marinum]EFQ83070.1 hypothetical protein HMPREF0063_12279 [Aeromicrobium marinum DSM 15272]
MTRRTVTTIVACLALAAASLLGASGAYADWDAEGDGDTVIIEGSQPGSTGSNPGGGTVVSVPQEWTETYRVPACSPNSVSQDAEGNTITYADVLCTAWSACPGDGENRWFVYTRVHPVEGRPTNWAFQGSECRAASQGSEGGPVQITEADVLEAVRETAPRPVVNAEPTPVTYVNVPTNFSTTAAGETRTVTVLGVALQVQFEPTTATWSFGDGSSATGAGIAGAAVGAPGAVEHQYRRAGTRQVSVTQAYTVTVVVPGAPTITLGTPLTTTSDPFALEVGEIQSLVTRVR